MLVAYLMTVANPVLTTFEAIHDDDDNNDAWQIITLYVLTCYFLSTTQEDAEKERVARKKYQPHQQGPGEEG